MKTVRKISIFSIILAGILILSSCSSGSSSSEGGGGPLDLTGNWRGTVTFVEIGSTNSGSGGIQIVDSGLYGAVLTVAQDRPITLAGTSSADFALQVTATDGCVWILNVEGATVNGRTRSFSASDSDGALIGTVSNNKISGSFNLGAEALTCGLVGGRAEFRRE